MRAVRFHHGTVTIEDRPIPTPGPDEALIRVIAAGICNTDLELRKGYMAFSGTPGHEFVGRVHSAPGALHLEGARVTADINAGCGHCPRCLAGDPRHCPDRRTLGIANLDGAFAHFLTIPLANLRPVPDSVSDDAAVFAEPLAAALEIAQQLHLTADLSLAVLGDGKLGLLIALALRLYCPTLVLIGRHSENLAIAAAQGVATALSGQAQPRFDIVVEATGRPDGLAQALDLVRPEGTVVLKSTTHDTPRLDLTRVVVDEITLVGSRCGNIALALSLLERRLLDPTPLIRARFPLERFAEAFAEAAHPGSGKVLVVMGDE